jgi:hypothetical protein
MSTQGPWAAAHRGGPPACRMVEKRQLAERQRVAGNAAYKAGQWSEALRCYELGLEAQRHNTALHANAAMAALKIQCYVQAMEHCSKVRASTWRAGRGQAHACVRQHWLRPCRRTARRVHACVPTRPPGARRLQVLHLSELLHSDTSSPLCVKAYQRRAVAYEVGRAAAPSSVPHKQCKCKHAGLLHRSRSCQRSPLPPGGRTRAHGRPAPAHTAPPPPARRLWGSWTKRWRT